MAINTGACASLLYSNAIFADGSVWYPAKRLKSPSQPAFAKMLSHVAFKECVPISTGLDIGAKFLNISRNQVVA
jgi:hypothetical protein